ncbi:hypothetical protein ABZX39_32475 [Streptomyces collinus]|uniref:hypothetical protein n=1 Tax=Streptomyces collinus TaxID=42684 RepID=UPI0033A181F5
MIQTLPAGRGGQQVDYNRAGEMFLMVRICLVVLGLVALMRCRREDIVQVVRELRLMLRE